MATATATPMINTSWYWMLMPNRPNCPETIEFTVRWVLGFQMIAASPVRITIRPRVTITGRSAEAPWSRRIRPRSTTAPARGAPTRSTITRARTTDMPSPATNSQ